jgi:hypothetical protein
VVGSNAQTTPSVAYVHASRAAIRSQPSATAPAAGYVTTNTRVEVDARSGEWCKVRTKSVPAPGFIACRFLGEAPLTLEAIDAKLADSRLSPQERLDWESRGFWIAPSLLRLQSVGAAMDVALLSEKAYSEEMSIGRANRPSNAEFDAMKTRLAAGIIPAAHDARPRSIEGSEKYYWEPLQAAMKRIALPKVAASFFRADEPLFALALRPFGLNEQGMTALGLADALSAVHRVPLNVRVLAPAGYYHGGPIGTWDISAVGIRFNEPVMVHAITARGEPTGLAVSSMRGPIGNQPCTGYAMSVIGKRLNSRWLAATLAWVGKAATTTPTVATTQSDGTGKYDRVTAERVDLNGDKIADFLIWTGVWRSILDEGELGWKAVFANVDGKWVLVAFAHHEECT